MKERTKVLCAFVVAIAVFHILLYGVSVRFPFTSAFMICGALPTITTAKRKRIEKRLRESEEKYRKQFEKSLDAIFLADAETGILVDCNPAATKLVGRKKSELIGKHQRILHPPELTEGEFTRTFKKHRKGTGGQVAGQVITKNGEIRDVIVNSTSFEVEGKKFLQGTFHDITERKKAEERLQEEKERFETYLNLARVIMLALDAEGIVTYVNKRGCDVLGYEREEIVGKDWFTNFLPERLANTTKQYAKKLLAGQMKPVEYNENPVVTKSGEERIIAWHNILLRDEEGKPIGTLSSGSDITKLKKTRQEMRDLSYRLNGITPGECYISESEEKIMKLFAYSVVYGRPGLCITRKNPEMLTEKYSLKPQHIRLLSSTPIKGFQVLSNLQEVSLEISNFLKNGGGIVLLDGLEYLVSRFSFNSVYSMLQEKRFNFLAAKSVLLIPVNFEALTSQERALLASEFKTIK